MRLVNIHNRKRIVYLFLRDEEGKQVIKKDSSFFPYYFEPDPEGTSGFVGYDGTKLRKVFCSAPGEVRERRSNKSFEADIIYTRRYTIDRIKTIDPCPIRYMFLDIEVLTREFPDYKKSKAPISCLTVYDSFTEEYHTWYLGDMPGDNLYDKEQFLLGKFIEYIKENPPDLWFSWNVSFDYNYLQSRVDRFAQTISPIGLVRIGDHENKIFYPGGISILDYLQLFKKVYMREQSYQLDYIAQKHLGEQPYEKTKFDKLSPEIKAKNINDVKRMVALEKKFKLVPYYNAIRMLSKSNWEDLYYNSRVIEMLIFEEAKKKGVILPNKPQGNEKEEFQGATRDVERPGVSYDIGKYDLGAAYPSVMIDFCLDPANMMQKRESNTETLEIDGQWVKQDSEALLPTVLKRLLILKQQLKKDRDSVDSNDPKYEDARVRYDAIKAVVNSGYGVMGNRFFRLYDNRVAALTTYLVRSVLLYVKEELDKKRHKVLYWDTDSVFIDVKKNIVLLLNTLIQNWVKNKYPTHRKGTSLEFEYEGQFEKILILKKCRYFGYLNDGKHVKEEIKGIEVKRSDSSKFMAEFQRNLINKLLDKVTKKMILTWIRKEVRRMKTLSIEQIAFPCKIGRSLENYKNIPIFVRALKYANQLTTLDKVPGELFFYIYIVPKDYEYEGETAYYLGQKRVKDLDALTPEQKEKLRTRKLKPKGPRNVIAFDEQVKDHVQDIDFKTMIQRNILSKCETLFEALNWSTEELHEIT